MVDKWVFAGRIIMKCVRPCASVMMQPYQKIITDSVLRATKIRHVL